MKNLNFMWTNAFKWVIPLHEQSSEILVPKALSSLSWLHRATGIRHKDSSALTHTLYSLQARSTEQKIHCMLWQSCAFASKRGHQPVFDATFLRQNIPHGLSKRSLGVNHPKPLSLQSDCHHSCLQLKPLMIFLYQHHLYQCMTCDCQVTYFIEI